ncbi:MAG: HPr family phosphocarrier protein [Phycisphaerae bacterium]
MPHATREVTVRNKEGVHARPVMRFVDLASKYRAQVSVTNVSRGGEKLDGKSAMHLMLLEAVQGNVLCVEATGDDAQQAVDALVALVEAAFHMPRPDAST